MNFIYACTKDSFSDSQRICLSEITSEINQLFLSLKMLYQAKILTIEPIWKLKFNRDDIWSVIFSLIWSDLICKILTDYVAKLMVLPIVTICQ